MSDETAWNDESREDLRKSLQAAILGECRLAKRDYESILEGCRETYIEEECPEDEWDEFNRFAAEELDRVAAQLASEESTWPDETDCDRLDLAEAALRERGILLWQASPCCDTCTRAELMGRIDDINEREPGFYDRVRGYSFFIDQNLPEKLSDDPALSVYLGYGSIEPAGPDVSPEVYEEHSLAIAREVCECLSGEGLKVDWDGSFKHKIRMSLVWQRRTPLE